MIELSIIVPCYNEAGNIQELVSRTLALFNKNALTGEIILINDGSVDGTAAEIERLSQEFKNIVIGVNHAKNLGITEAWYSGLKKSQGRYVVTIDADLQYSPEDILLLYQEMATGQYDLVQGWRKEYKDKNLLRQFMSRTLSYLLNLLFFTKIQDIKSGFVLYKREAFLEILAYRKKFRVFQHFFILCALKQGYRMKQVAVTFFARIHGESFIKHPFLFSFQVLLDIPKALWFFGFTSRKNR